MAQDAPRIDRVEQLVTSANFAEARAEAQAVLGSGKLHRRDVARVYVQMGIIAAARREDDFAQAAFRKALVLEPASTLPDSAGPHIDEAWKTAAATVARSPALAPSAQLTPVANRAEVWVEPQIAGDSEHLVRRLRINAQGVAHVRDLADARGRFLEALPEIAAHCATVTVDALDENGNELFPGIAHGDVCPATVAGEAGAHETIAPLPDRKETGFTNSRPVPGYVWGMVGLTAAGVGATAVLGTIALGKAHDYNDASQRTPTQRDDAAGAEHRATAAAILTAGAGAATLILYFTRPVQPVRVGASAAPGGAMLLISGGL